MDLRSTAPGADAKQAGIHTTMGTPDAREGLATFLEKRKPVFNYERGKKMPCKQSANGMAQVVETCGAPACRLVT
jgi:hypothetical protein